MAGTRRSLGSLAYALTAALSVWLFAEPMIAQAPKPSAPAPTGTARPSASILDRDLLFADPEITSPQISPDGRHVGFLKVFKGTRQVWVKQTAAPMATAKAITSDPRRSVTSWLWSRDGRHVLFIPAGETSVNLYAVQPAGAVAPGQDVPSARNLTQLSRGQLVVYATPAASPDTVVVGIADRQPGLFDVYRVGIGDGTRTLVHKNAEGVSAWVFDNAGALRLGVRTTTAGDSQLVAIGTAGLRVVLTCTAFESCTPLRFHSDNTRVYLTSNRGASDLLRLVLLDPETGGEQTAHVDPAGRVDVGRVTFSQLTGEPAVVTYSDERLRSYVAAQSYDADYQALTKQLPGLDVELSSVSGDNMVWVVTATSDVEPGEIHVFDRRTRKAVLQYRVREQLPRDALAPMRAIRYPSRDGLQIPAYLTLPGNTAAANLPLVVVPHGGPWSRDSWGFNPLAQLLANRGYAVLQPNFRGSVGYGRKFLDAGNGQWGRPCRTISRGASRTWWRKESRTPLASGYSAPLTAGTRPSPAWHSRLTCTRQRWPSPRHRTC